MAAVAALSQPFALQVDAMSFLLKNSKRQNLIRGCTLSSRAGREMILTPGCRKKRNRTTANSTSLDYTIDF
jgi:hypothetical protein